MRSRTERRDEEGKEREGKRRKGRNKWKNGRKEEIIDHIIFHFKLITLTLIDVTRDLLER